MGDLARKQTAQDKAFWDRLGIGCEDCDNLAATAEEADEHERATGHGEHRAEVREP